MQATMRRVTDAQAEMCDAHLWRWFCCSVPHRSLCLVDSYGSIWVISDMTPS